jgi:putative membrane protein
MKAVARSVLLILGLALFAWFVYRAGPAEIWRTCLSVGWFAPLLLLPYAAVYAADTLGWRFTFRGALDSLVGYWKLYRVRWCGEALNNVIPSAYIGGELLKVYLLHKRGVNAGMSATSVITGRTVQTLTQVMFIAAGAAAFWGIAAAGSGVRRAMLVVLAGSIIAVTVLFWLQTHGLFSILLRTLPRFGLRIAALESRRARLEQIDRQVVDFYRNGRRYFFLSGGAYFCGWLLDTMDIYVVMWLLGEPISWPQALAIEAFVGVAKILGLLVPGALGVQESGILLVSRLAGVPDTLGLAYAILRRGREVIFASIGWLLLYFEESTMKGLTERIEAESEAQL